MDEFLPPLTIPSGESRSMIQSATMDSKAIGIKNRWSSADSSGDQGNIFEAPTKASTCDQKILDSQTRTLTMACESDTRQTKELFVQSFMQLLNDVEFEFGYKTSADDYIGVALRRYATFAREWLNEIFLQNFENPLIISSILRVIAHFDYSQMYPQGMTIAIAATRHRDKEVQECGVRCFENWESRESIAILRNLSFTDSWLNEYLDAVIADLEELG